MSWSILRTHILPSLCTLLAVLGACEGPTPSAALGHACFTPIEGPSEAEATALAGSGGSAWAGTDLGLFARTKDGWAPVLDAALATQPVLAVEATAHDVFVAVGGPRPAVYHAHDGTGFSLTTGAPATFGTALFASNGARWVASFDGALHDWDDTRGAWVRAIDPDDPTFPYRGTDVAAFDGEVLHVSGQNTSGVFSRDALGRWSRVGTLSAWGYASIAFGRGRALVTDWDAIFSRDALGVWTKLADTEAPILGVRIGTRAVFASSGYGGYLRSLDDGATWSKLDLAGSAAASRIAVTDSEVLAIGPEAIASSLDDGATWTSTRPRALAVRDLSLAGETVVATTARHAYATTDRGASFTTQDSSLVAVGEALYSLVGTEVVDHASASRHALPAALAAAAPSVRLHGITRALFAGAPTDVTRCSDARPGAFFRSTDGGLSWEDASRGLAGGGTPCGAAAQIVPAIVRVREVGEALYAFSTDAGVFRSFDGGLTWAALPGQDAAERAPFHAAARGRSTSWAASPAGLYRSDDDGDHWSRVSAFLDRAIGDVQTRGALVFVSVNEADGGVWVSSDDGATFVRLDDALRLPVGALAITQHAIYAAVAARGLYVATGAACAP